VLTDIAVTAVSALDIHPMAMESVAAGLTVVVLVPLLPVLSSGDVVAVPNRSIA